MLKAAFWRFDGPVTYCCGFWFPSDEISRVKSIMLFVTGTGFVGVCVPELVVRDDEENKLI
ncbi:MAG TPA: hypothetical protein DCL48_09015 [Alphaproteobacteria bacterium]|nr:hypothetical protein [Alphaproteobacteria bacterium]